MCRCKKRHLSIIHIFALVIFPSFPLLFFWTRNHEHDDSLPVFLFLLGGMTSFSMIVMTDGQCLMSCSWMIKVMNVQIITWEATSLNELKIYKIATWNHRDYSHICMCHWWCLSIRELPWFCSQNKFLQVLELEQAWLWIKYHKSQ